MMTRCSQTASSASLILAAAVSGLFLVSCQKKEQATPATFTAEGTQSGRPAGAGPPPGARSAADGELRDHPEELTLEPPPGREFFVWNNAPAGGDGSVRRPWNDLRSAMKNVRPGDRLVLLPGRYNGPIVIDDAYPAGEPGRPIELYSRVDAVFVPGGDEPVVSIRRNGWTLIGAEIEPLKNVAPALEIANASDVTIRKAHLHDGAGNGVHVDPGSERVTIEDSHIHMFGARRGKSGKGATAEVFGVRIAPGTRDVTLRRCNIHNISGPTVKVLTPAEFEAAGGAGGLPPASGVNLEKTLQQANWPEVQ